MPGPDALDELDLTHGGRRGDKLPKLGPAGGVRSNTHKAEPRPATVDSRRGSRCTPRLGAKRVSFPFRARTR